MHTSRSILLATLLALFAVAGCKSSGGADSPESEAKRSAPADKTDEGESEMRTRRHGGEARAHPGHSDSDAGAEHHAEMHGHAHGDTGGHTAEMAKGHGRHHDFDNPEKYAADWNSEERDTWQKPEEVVELMGAGSGDTVVDLGTGTGYFLPHLSRAVGEKGRVLALDVSEKMLAYVDDEVVPGLPHDNVETRRVARDDPGLDADSVDHVLMVNTWHHVRDRVGYGEKLLAALKPGGTFVDVDYTMETDRGPPKKIRLTPKEVVSELEEAGFDARIADESLPKQYVVIATKPDE